MTKSLESRPEDEEADAAQDHQDNILIASDILGELSCQAGCEGKPLP